jgi:hypothetical protein
MYVFMYLRTSMYVCMYIYMYVCVCMYVYISVEEDTAALGGRKRPRQDRGDVRGGKSGPLCAKSGRCLERD